LFTSSSCLLPYCSHLVVDIVFVAHALLLSRSRWLFTPCIALSLHLLPCHCALLPPCHHTLLLPFSSAS
jgi:hypothetical protein